MKIEIDPHDLWKRLYLLGSYPTLSELSGHEDNIGQKLLIPILTALGYDDIREKPQLFHAITGKQKREPDYGIYEYNKSSAKRTMFGMIAEKKAYGATLTHEIEEKLAGYCVLTGALYGILTNGKSIIVIKPKRGAICWDYINQIPSKSELENELKESKVKYKRDDIIFSKRIIGELNEEIMENIAQKCHNIIRSRKGMAVPERLYEFSKLIVSRIVDERRYSEGKQQELLITAENVKLMKEKKQNIKDYIKNILKTISSEIGIFNEEETVNLDDDIIEQIIEYLDDYQLWSEKMDVLGHVYEKFLMNTMTGRELGGYFTPRPIVDLVVKITDPSFGKTILDPACGSGGFLISSLIYLKDKHNMHSKNEIKTIASTFYGMDIFLVIAKLSQINLWLHGDCHDNVYRTDSLDLTNDTPKIIVDALKNPSEKGFDFILTNPPYGADEGNKIPKERLKTMSEKWHKNGINLYECVYGSKGMINLQPQVPFIELCIKLLKEGGKLGVVIDNGILSNVTEEAPVIRKIIKKYCIIEAVIGLPKGSFRAYGSNVIPVILIVRKKYENEEQGSVFRAEARKIGLIPGRTDYVKDSDADLIKIYDLWNKFGSEREKKECVIYDDKLPIWITLGDDYRIDNNFFSPSAIEATKIVHNFGGYEYEIKKLDEIKEIITNGISPSSNGDIPILKGSNIQPNYILPAFSKFGILQETNKEFLVEEGDILMVKDGSPGTVTAISKVFTENYEKSFASYHLHLIRLKGEYKKHAFFISSFLNSKVGQALVRKYISGSVSPTIRGYPKKVGGVQEIGEVGKIEVLIPKDEKISVKVREEIEQLQQNVISSRDFLKSSMVLDSKINPNGKLPALPINWMPGGKGDKHGYYKD